MRSYFMIPEPRLKLLLIVTRPYCTMLDACAVITALMKWPENNFQLTVGRLNFFDIQQILFVKISFAIENWRDFVKCKKIQYK